MGHLSSGIVLLAIAFGASGISSAAEPWLEDPTYWTSPPDPLNLYVSLDADHAATAMIETSGGTLSATGADGTVFNLTFPDQSLPMAMNITMTPVRQITARGKTAGQDQVMAVQIEPSGTVLFAPARLEIVPKSTPPDAVQAPFAYDGFGEDAGLIVPDTSEEGIVVLLDHFSGYGAVNWSYRTGEANEYDMVNLIMDQIAFAHAEKRLPATAGNELAKKRQKQLLGRDDARSLGEIMDSAEASWDKELFQPQLSIALNPAASCEQVQGALRLILGRERLEQLTGHSGPTAFANPADAERFKEALAATIDGCRRDVFSACLASGDYHILILAYLGETRQWDLLGYDATMIAATRQAYEDMVTQCAVYVLRYTMTQSTSIQPRWRLFAVLEGHVTLKAVVEGTFPEGLKIVGQSDGVTDPQVISFECAGGTREDVFNLECGLGARVESFAYAQIRSMTLRLPVGTADYDGLFQLAGENTLDLGFVPANVTVAVNDNINGSGTSWWPLLGVIDYWEAHGLTDISPPVPGFTRAGYPTLFQTTYADTSTDDTGTYSDSTVFELIHTPQATKPPATPSAPPRKPLVKP